MGSSAQTLFTDVVVHRVDTLVRARGFRGSAGTWTRTSALGDCAIVNLQKSKWNTANKVGFFVNLALVPKPWFEWDRQQFRLPPSRKPREYDGLWRERLHPSPRISTDRELWFVEDPASAQACGTDVVERLDRIGIPRLLELLDRDSLMRAIRAGDFGYTKRSPLIPMAIMLSDSGPGPELEDAIEQLESQLPGWRDWALREQFVTWIRDRAEQRRH